LETEKSFDEINDLVNEINLLIITANDIETIHVRQVLRSYGNTNEIYKVPHENHTYFIGRFGEYNAVHVKLGKMGSIKSEASILTTYTAIEIWKPKAVVMIGVAMGVDEKKQNIGDVLVSESIMEYESQRVGKKGTTYRGSIVEGGSVLLDRFKNVSSWTNDIGNDKVARIFPGAILSGEKLIDNLTLRNRFLKHFPTAIGAEMEGAGVYAACRKKNLPEWILIKGICDYGDGYKGIDKEARQNLAAQSSTSLCLKVFGSKIAFKSIGLNPVVREAATNEDEITKFEEIEEEIINMVEPESKKDSMHSKTQITVTAFLELNSYQKVVIIEKLGVSLTSLSNLSGYEMDKEFFRFVKNHNLLADLWNAINEIKPFKINQNPFL